MGALRVMDGLGSLSTPAVAPMFPSVALTVDVWSHDFLAFLLLAAVCVTAAIFDGATGKIPNRLAYPAILAGFVLAAVMGFATNGVAGAGELFGLSAFGFLVAAAPMLLIFMSGALGGGDVKLMAAVGAISADWEVVLGTAMYGFTIAMLMALVLMFKHRIFWRTVRRITGAAMLTAARAKVKPDIDTDTPKIPLAIGFCLGALIAGSEHLLHVPMPWR